MVSKSKFANSILTATQKGLALGGLLGLLNLMQACSGQAQKTDINFSKANKEDRDASPDKSNTPKPGDKDYSSETPPGNSTGGSNTDMNSTPSTPQPDASADESASSPQPVTGSPSDKKEREEGQLIDDSFYRIRNNYTKKCLIVHQQSSDVGAQIVQGNCNDPTAIFATNFVDHKYYMLTNKKTQYALQIRGQLAVSEALLEQGNYRSRDYQKWNFLRQSDNTYLIKPMLNEGLCLDVSFGSKDDNTPIQLWRECTALGEKWLLEEID